MKVTKQKMYGWWNNVEGSIRYIHPSIQAVKMCSPDGFAFAITCGLGKIIPVWVSERKEIGPKA